MLVDMDVTDPDRYDEYKALAGPAVEQYGGRYIVRGGASEVLEGDRTYHRTVVIEFPDADSARNWYHGPEYTRARGVRATAAIGNFLLVEGA
ncbi:MAG: DUF1330 domain-containing protein [Acidimicrobiia bacterium]